MTKDNPLDFEAFIARRAGMHICFFSRHCGRIMCPDETKDLAVISLGDVYLPELKREKT